MIVRFKDLLRMNTKDYFERYHAKLCYADKIVNHSGERATNYFLNKVIGKAKYNQNCYDQNMYYKHESIKLFKLYQKDKKQCYAQKIIIDELNEKFRLLMFYKMHLKHQTEFFVDHYEIVEIDSNHVNLIKKEEA
ncbi:hypothetical protein LCA30_02265 [Vibrio harveyi]